MTPALIALCAYEAPALGLGIASGFVGMRGERALVRAGAAATGFVAWQFWLPEAVWLGAVAAWRRWASPSG